MPHFDGTRGRFGRPWIRRACGLFIQRLLGAVTRHIRRRCAGGPAWVCPSRTGPVRAGGPDPKNVRRIIRSRSGDPSTPPLPQPSVRPVLCSLGWSFCRRPVPACPLHRSRTIGLTGPRDLYLAAHSPVQTNYLTCRDISVPRSDLNIGMAW